MEDLLKILIDAELNGKSSEKIENQLNGIASKYSGMKIKAELDPDSIKGMNSLLKNIEAMGAKMGDVGEKAGKGAKNATENVTDSIKHLKKELKDYKKESDKITRSGKTNTKIKGNKYKQSKEKFDSEGNLIDTEVVRHYEKVTKVVDEVVKQSKDWNNLTDKQKKKVTDLAEKIKETYVNDEKGREKIGSKKMLNDMERLNKHYVDAKDKNKEINQIQEKSQKLQIDYEGKINKLREQGVLSEKEINELGKKVNTSKQIKSMDKFIDRQREVNSLYGEMLEKQTQNLAVSQKLEQAGMNEKKRKDGQSKVKIGDGEVDVRTKDVNAELDRKAKNKVALGEQWEILEKDLKHMVQEGEITSDDFNRIEKLYKEIGISATNVRHEIAKVKQELRITKKNNKARNGNKIKKAEDGVDEEGKKANEEMERKRKNATILNEQWELFNMDLQQLVKEGKITKQDFKKVKNLFSGITEESENVRHEIAKVNKVLRNIKSKRKYEKGLSSLDGQTSEQKDMDMEIKRRTLNDRVDKIKNGGLGAKFKNELEDIYELIRHIDSSSSKIDLDDVVRQIKSLEEAEQNIVQGLKEEEQVLKEVRKQRKSIASMQEKLVDKFDSTKYKANKQLGNNDNKNNVMSMYDRIEEQIEDLKDLDEEQARAKRRQINDQIKDLDKLVDSYKELEKHQRQSEQAHIKESNRQRKLGDEVRGHDLDMDFIRNSGIRSNQNYIQNNINGVIERLHDDINPNDINRDMIKVRQTLNEFGEAVYRVEYQIRRGEREFEDYSLSIDTTSNSVRDLGRNMRQLRPEMGIFEQFGQAMQKVPIWMIASSAFYGIGSQMARSFEVIMEVDKAMTNLHKVADETQSELRDFRMEASEIGNEMGLLAKDVIEATTEFVRLGYALEEAKGLSETSLVYANVGDMEVMDASTSLIGALKGFAIAEEDVVMKSKRFIDIFNEVGNNFAISSEGIGEALKRSSATLYQAGNTVEQSVALITAGNSAVQDPKKVGTALKTISMRLRGVDEEGEKVKGLMPELEKLFQRFDKSIMNEAGDGFKTTYEMMDILSENWEKLSDMEKAQTVEAIGGKRQGAIVSAIIQNWQDAEDAHNTALSSMGSAQREFHKYMDSMQYKVGRLKNAWQDFWLTFWDDDSVKTAIDSLTSITRAITNMTEEWGVFAPMTILLIPMALAMSKVARNAVFLGRGMTRVRDAVSGLTALPVGETLKKWGKRLGFLALRLGGFAVAITAVTFVIESAINIWARESRARQQRISDLQDERVETQKLLDTLDPDKIDRYEELTKMSASGDLGLEERNEFNNLLAEIEGVMPNLIEYYDEEGKAHYKTADAIRKEVDARRDRNIEIDKEIGLEQINGYDFSKVTDALKAKNQAQITPEDMGLEIGTNALRDFFNKSIENSKIDEGWEVQGEKYKEGYRKMMSDLKDTMTEEQFKGFVNNSNSVVSLNTFQRQNTKEDAEAFISNMEKTVENVKKKSVSKVKEAEKAIDRAGEDLSRPLQNIARGIAKESNIKLNSNEFLMLEMITENFHKGLIEVGASKEKVIEFLEGFEKDAVEIISKMEISGIDLEEMLKNGGTEEQMKLMEDFAETYKGSAGEMKVVDEILNHLTKTHLEHNNSLRNANGEIIDMVANVDKLSAEYDNQIKKVGSINKILKELDENGSLSAESIGRLLSEYPDLIQYINDEETLVKKLMERREQEGNLAIEHIKEKLMMDNEYFKEVSKANKDYFKWLKEEGYEKDLKAFKDLASLKQDVEEQLIKNISEKWRDFYDAQSLSLKADPYNDRKLQVMAKQDPEGFKLFMEQQRKATEQIQESRDRMDAIIMDDIPSIDFSKIGVNDKKGGKESEPDYRDTIDAWIRMNQLESQNVEDKAKRIEVLSKQAKEEDKLNKQIEYQNRLLKTQKGNVDELQEANDNLHKKANNIRSNTKWDTSFWFDKNGEATVKYTQKYNSLSKEQQEQMDKVFVRLQKLKRQYGENAQSIKGLNQEILNTNRSIEDLKLESVERKFSRLTDSINLAYDRIGNVISRIDQGFSYLEDGEQSKELQLINKKTKALQTQMSVAQNAQRQLERLKKSVADYPEVVKDVESRISKWKDEQNSLDLAIYQNSMRVKSLYKELADDVIDHYIDALERERDAKLETVEDQIKSEDERHKNRMDNIDEEMKKFEEYINQQIEALDDQKNKDDFEKQLRKLNQQRQKIQSKINSYAMDDTLEGKAKKKELEEELAKLEEQIHEHKNSRMFKEQKEALQDQLDEKKDNIEDQKDLETELHEHKKDELDDEKELLNKSYENKIANEKKWLKIRKDIFSGNISSIKEEMGGFINDISSGMTDLDSNIKQNLINSLQKTVDLMGKLKEQNPNGFVAPKAPSIGDIEIPSAEELIGDKELKDSEMEDIINTGTGSVLETTDYKLMGSKFLYDKLLPFAENDNQEKSLKSVARGRASQARDMGTVLDPNNTENFDSLLGSMSNKEKLATAKYIAEYVLPDIQTESLKDKIKDIIGRIADSARSSLGEDFWKDKNFMQSISSFDTGGYTGQFNNGRMAVLHEKELVLNKADTSNILNTVKVVRDLAKMIPKINMPNFNIKTDQGGSGDTYIDVKFNIDKVSGGEQGAKNLMKRFNDGLKRKGVQL